VLQAIFNEGPLSVRSRTILKADATLDCVARPQQPSLMASVPSGLSEWAWWGDLRPELVRGLALASLSPSGWTLPHRPVFPILIGYPDPSGPHLLGDGVGPTRPKTSSRGSEGLVGALLRALHNALPVWFRYTLEGPKLC
jgi:hypothetical protein